MTELKLRPADPDDLAFLSELGRDPVVERFLAPGAAEPERLEELMVRVEVEGPPSGVFVIRAPSGEALGGLALVTYSERSRIVNLMTLMVRPEARGSGVGTSAVRLAARHALLSRGFHRLQAETYGDNHAGRRLFERAGFTREGVRRRAYWRRNEWLDGIMYGILAEELD